MKDIPDTDNKIQYNIPSIVTKIKNGYKPNTFEITACDKDGNTPLHYYIANNAELDMDVINVLRIGVLNATNKNKNNPLHLYLMNNDNPDINIIKLLKTDKNLNTHNKEDKEDGENREDREEGEDVEDVCPLTLYIKNCDNIRIDIIKELKTKENINNLCDGIIPLVDYIVREVNPDIDTNIMNELISDTNLDMINEINDRGYAVLGDKFGNTEEDYIPIENGTALHIYTMSHGNYVNIDIIKQLKTPINLDICDEDNCTILHNYLMLNTCPKISIIKELVTLNNINIYHHEENINPLIYYLCFSKTYDINIIRILKGDMDKIDENGNIFLMKYVRKKHVYCNYITEFITDTNLNIYNHKKSSPLLCYLEHRTYPDINIIRLLKTNENLNKENDEGFVPLTMYLEFADKYNTDIIKELKTEDTLNNINMHGTVSLTFYLCNNVADSFMVTELATNKNLNMMIHNRTILDMYVHNNLNNLDIDIIKLLKTNENLNYDNDGDTTLSYYLKHCKNVDINIIRQLKTNKNLDILCKDDNIPLTVCLQNKKNNMASDIVTELISQNNLNMTIMGEHTPILIYIIVSSMVGGDIDLDILKLLISDENLDMVDAHNDTPLLKYLQNNDDPDKETIKMLVTEDNLEICNMHGVDPLQSYIDFCDEEDEDILIILESHA